MFHGQFLLEFVDRFIALVNNNNLRSSVVVGGEDKKAIARTLMSLLAGLRKAGCRRLWCYAGTEGLQS